MSPVDVCNLALSHIGDRRITRLDEEAQMNDPLASYCALFYEQAKNEVLAAHRWTFAKRATPLARRINEIPFGNFQYVHALPVDCLRVLDLILGEIPSATIEDPTPTAVYGSTKVDGFAIIGRDVWSNELYLGLYYISKSEDPTTWTPHFTAAVSRLLAHYLCGAIADNSRMGNNFLEIYERVALPNAQFYDAVQDQSGENYHDQRGGSPTLLARYQSSRNPNYFED